jgi:hypothetical protein
VSNSQQAVNDLLNGSSGPPAFKFEAIGDIAKGTITNLETQQAKDFKTQAPKFYDDGNPIMQIVITQQPENGDEFRLFVKPAAKEVIRDAVEAAGATGLEIGGQLATQWTAEEPPQQIGMNPKKLFAAQYKAPANTISASDLLA